jgi:hypothetical protein
MLMKVLLLLFICWVDSTDSMITDFQLKSNFCVVAKHIGFDIEKMHIFKNINETEYFAQQEFGKGWKLIRMNSIGLFKITACACDNGALKEGYYHTDWMNFNKVLIYEVDDF